MKKNKPSLLGCLHGISFLLVLAWQGCVPPPPAIPPAPPGIALNEMCKRYNVSWQWDGVTQVVLLEYRENKAKALVGSEVVMVGKERVTLSGPVRRFSSTIYVPDDFEANVLVPLGIVPGSTSLNVDWSRMKLRTIIIDPGHGGKDPGAQGRSGLREKNVVLDISKRVKALLEKAGIRVLMTRQTDVFVSLPERTEMASKSDADLFVSIHANSNPARKTQGMEVYYAKTRKREDLLEEQRVKNEKMFARRLNMKYSPVLTDVVADMMYELKVLESERLAQTIVRQGSSYVDTPNRGARSSRFFVVRNTLVPAVLIEVGFLTNRHEEKKLGQPAYRQKLAEAITRSIINYASEI